MFRYIAPVLLPAMFLLPALPARGQFPGWGDALTGTYVNTSNGGTCYVESRGGDYVFVNENGTPAWFVFVSPGRLVQRAGGWDPNVTASVSQDGLGRTVIRFDSPFSPPGYWVRTF